MNPRVILKPGKAKPVLAHHPWIFSGAIARADDAHDGDTVDIFEAGDRWIARGYYNARSQITVRVWTWQDEPIDRAFLRARLQRAIAARTERIDPAATNACRLVNAESDFLPGLVIDRYADTIVMQFLTLGVDKRRAEFVEIAQELLQPHGIYERSDADVSEREGLAAVTGVLSGAEPPDQIEIRENKLRFLVDVKRGHKTGFYLDQRENRRRAFEYSPPPPHAAEILNVFSYTGAFAVYACAANPAARVVNLDGSRDALNLARENMRLNGVVERGEFVEADAFQLLRRYRDEAKSFDMIILDPPKFVHALSQLNSGLRGYKDINLLALKLLKPSGTLVTFSCSGQVSAELFQKVVFEAAVDARRDIQVVAKLLQAPDHPILLSFPESEYLKGLVCRAVG
ncbi:MAG TPA: class I SAM-dependent methyltransferase [Anaerolineae bacterium]